MKQKKTQRSEIRVFYQLGESSNRTTEKDFEIDLRGTRSRLSGVSDGGTDPRRTNLDLLPTKFKAHPQFDGFFGPIARRGEKRSFVKYASHSADCNRCMRNACGSIPSRFPCLLNETSEFVRSSLTLSRSSQPRLSRFVSARFNDTDASWSWD